MTAPDTNDDDLIARCQERAESFGSVPRRTLYDGERKYAEDVPALIAALTAAQAEIERLRELADFARLLGPARMVLDRCAEGVATPGEAADMAQRIVDFIGHPVTDEPPHALIELDRLRAKVKQGDALAAAARYSIEDDGGDLSVCPYYARYHSEPGHDPEATCAFGCRDEPECVTCRPSEGWPRERLAAALAAWEDTPGGDDAS